MLNRIKWSEITGKKKDKDGNYYSLFLKLRIRFLIKNLNKANPNEEKEKNSCSLVWEGMIKNRTLFRINNGFDTYYFVIYAYHTINIFL